MAINKGHVSGIEKAAILLISLGPDLSAQVMKHLPDDEIDALTLEIASTLKVDQDVRDKVLTEFNDMAVAQEFIDQGGLEYAKAVLEKALGYERAREVLKRLTVSLQVRPFDFAKGTDPSQLSNYLESESPQTVALVLSYLSPAQAAGVMATLPAQLQVDVSQRIAAMESTSPDVLKEVEKVLEHKVMSLVSQDYNKTGGVEAVVDILNNVDRQTEKTILNALTEKNPELSEEIKRRMFLFEDIISLDDRAVQLFMAEVDMTRDLPLAMKGSSDEVKQKILRNISSRAAETVQDSIDYLGPVRVRDVEEAQQRIVAVIRRLEEQGQIITSRGGGHEILV